MEKEHNPEIHDMKKQTTPSLQSSQTNPTPGLPFNPLASLTPEQIQQLALLQYLQNPFGGLGGLPNLAALPNQQPANPVAIQPSKPIVRTETLYTTNTIPLFFGNKKLFTTLTSAIGVTTITENPQPQATVAAALPQQPAFNPAAFNPAAAFNLQPSFTVTSAPVVEETVLPSTIYKEIKITFR